MKNIRIKELSLLNFKGIHELKIRFDGDVTNIYGRNASGKTSIFDAVTWLLFGKDSQGRDKFDIKTLDEGGKAIPKIPHSVSAVLCVDGADVHLSREYAEKWVKKRGSIEETFTGHEEKRLYNGVALSVADWKARIAGICDEATFKMVTNPSAFVSMDKKAQRQKLFEMAGCVSDKDIAAGNADFESLLSLVGSKPMEQYKQELAAAKRRVKQECASIPSRIDERRRDIDALADTDFMALHEQEQALTTQLATEEESLVNDRKNADEKSRAHEKAVAHLSELRERRVGVAYKIRARIAEEYHKADADFNNTQGELVRASDELVRCKKTVERETAELTRRQLERQSLINEWKEIQAEKLIFDSMSFVCPTCKRPLDDDDIEAKKAEMLANFNRDKAMRLDVNTRRGRECKERIEAQQAVVDKAKTECIAAAEKVNRLDAEYKRKAKPVPVDAEAVVQADAEYIRLSKEITDAQSAIDAPTKETLGDFELAAKVQTHREELNAIRAKLAQEATIEANEVRIKELETALRKSAQELADIEHAEYLIEAFGKAKSTAVESRINDLFAIVNFKLYEQQINGGEVETCEAMVDGVPYSSLNNAMRINAGLDIINAICKCEGITAPIVIDNSESINNIMGTGGQQIRLYVSDDEKLTIK